jgi:hypothetical protein
MEREALAALEKRVSALRVVAAEKAVLARSMSYGDPPRWHAEISTAILAVAVFALFMLGREVGGFVARAEPCAAPHRYDYAYVSYVTKDYDVTIDTNGYLWRRGRFERRVSADAVRDIVEVLVVGCFLETELPRRLLTSEVSTTLTLHIGRQWARQTYARAAEVPLCGGAHADVGLMERAIRNVADGHAD